MLGRQGGRSRATTSAPSRRLPDRPVGRTMKEDGMATLTVWKFPTAGGAEDAT